MDVGMLNPDDEKHACSLCHKEFKNLSDMKYHRKGCGSINCPECGKEFPDKVKLNRHINTHSTKFQCEVCDKRFANKQGLKRHGPVHTGERVDCQHCAKTFTDKANLARHIKKQHKQ